MITDAQLNELIHGLMAEIAVDEKSLERKRWKLENLLELRKVSMPDVPPQLTVLAESDNGHAVRGPYADFTPTHGIRTYLRDRGGSARMSDLLDALAGQVASDSDNPRHVIRNCVRQLSKKHRGVRIDGDTVTLLEAMRD